MSARFAIVPTIALEDERISHACLRILCVLCTFADKRGWCWPSLTTLAEKSRIARNDVTLHLKKLEAFGYIQRYRRGQNGRQLSNGYLVRFDFPPDSEFSQVGPDDLPRSDNPTYPRSDQATPPRSDHPTPNYPLNNKKDSGVGDSHEEPESKQYRPNGAAKPNGGAGFESWWILWTIPGTKRGKGQAKRAYRTATKAVSAELLAKRLSEHVVRWSRNDTDLRFIPHPASWLNGERWEDDIREAPKSKWVGL
jgi:Helix-turn-helix domain